MAFENPERGEEEAVLFPSLSDRAYFACSMLLFAIIILVLLYASSLFLGSAWATYDMQRFYAMAGEIARGATPYMDYQDSKPPLIYFALAPAVLLGHPLLGGLLLVGACNLASAALVMQFGWKMYGRFAGLVAGLLFTLSIAWAQGYFVMTEPFTVTFVLLATYFAFFSGQRHYFLAGICAGIAIGFKQYALITVPLLLLAMYLDLELKRAPELLAGVAIPLLVVFGAILAVYGTAALKASLFWSFGVAVSYAGTDDVNGVTSYRTSDPVMWAANFAMATSMFTSLIIIAFASVFKDRRLRTAETYFLLSGICFAMTLLIREYLHYWMLSLPFMALLCARLFRNDR